MDFKAEEGVLRLDEFFATNKKEEPAKTPPFNEINLRSVLQNLSLNTNW